MQISTNQEKIAKIKMISERKKLKQLALSLNQKRTPSSSADSPPPAEFGGFSVFSAAAEDSK